MTRLVARNQVFLLAKHYSPDVLRRFLWPVVVGHSLWGLMALRHGVGLAFLTGKWEGLRRSKSFPKAETGEAFRQFLESSERQIREAQRPGRSDFYWRVYFLLTSAGAD
jgi:hypothetical protein